MQLVSTALTAAPPVPSPLQLTATINRLYSDTMQRLEGALAAVCADFRPSHYTKVLEGYMFLGNVAQVGACPCPPHAAVHLLGDAVGYGGVGLSKAGGPPWLPLVAPALLSRHPCFTRRGCAHASMQLGDEVKSAFIATIGSSAAKVVRGVLLTRPGFEKKAAMAANLQVRCRGCKRRRRDALCCANITCCAQDFCNSHACRNAHCLHPQCCTVHAGPPPTRLCPPLQELVRFLPSDLFRTCLARVLMVLYDILVSHFHMVRWHEAALERHTAEAAALGAAKHALEARLGGSPAAEGAAAGGAAAAAAAEVAADDDPFGGWASGGAADPLPPLGSPGGGEVTVTGRAVMGLQVQLQRGTASELEELEAKASDEAEWGTVLQVGCRVG